MRPPPAFELDHKALADDARYAPFAGRLGRLSPIDSAASFDRYCREACRLWDEQFGSGPGKPSRQFAELREQINAESDAVIRTGWGGVVITLHQPPLVEKFLVVRKSGYLALEMHEKKDERLEVREGHGLILWRRHGERALTVQPIHPGDSFHLEPLMEHCLIGTENLLVFERSIDPKGMDQDLIFIYEPENL